MLRHLSFLLHSYFTGRAAVDLDERVDSLKQEGAE